MLLNLKTNEEFTYHKVTEILMPQSMIDRVEELGKLDGIKPAIKKDHKLIVVDKDALPAGVKLDPSNSEDNDECEDCVKTERQD